MQLLNEVIEFKMSFNLTGDLTKDALGLWQCLEKQRPAGELAECQALYGALHQGGWVAERNISRPPGASYNPRPARLVRLLLETNPGAPLVEVEAAFILGAYGLPSTVPPEGLRAWTEAFTLAGQALRPSGGSKADHDPSLPTTLAAIRLLDDVRHLHQRGLSPSELHEHTLRAQANCLALKGGDGNSSLIQRIEATCEKILQRRDCLQP